MREYGRVRVHPKTGDRSMTKQSFKEECDFNLIIKNYRQTGQATHVRRGEPAYGDFDQAMGLQEAIAKVNAVTDSFNGLTSQIRDAAENDPMQFVKMLETNEGIGILEAAGLDIFEPEEETEPVTDPVTSEPVVKAGQQSPEED